MTPTMDCDVLICGAGPVGQLLALLLGRLGVSTIAIDEAAEPYELPRAAIVDDEVLRVFQAAGVERAIMADAQIQRAVSYVTAGGRTIEVLRPAVGEYGHAPLVSIHQPSVERSLVAALDEQEHVELRWELRLEAVDRRADHVTAWARPTAGGRSVPITARWLVGCDGGRSAVRSRVGVAFGGSTFAQRWLVVDAFVDRPLVRVPHPHFVGDWRRPIVTLPMSPGRHRWEWMLHPGEDEAPLLETARIETLIAPWLDGERIEIERAVVYTFHARTAARWRAGRVLLAGDAAHVMPPFVGQGFSSGARDAANLAWKLDAVLRGAPDRLLDSYETERRPHVTRMQSLAVRWGAVVQTTSPRTGRVRDTVVEALDRSGALAWIRERIKPLPTCRAGAFADRPHRLPFRRSSGALFPQPEVTAPGGDTLRLDDLIGPGWAALCAGAEAASALAATGVPVFELGRDVVDPSGVICDWFSRHGADWVLLRPDRFVFACGSPADIAQAMQALRALVGAAAFSTRARLAEVAA
jgi:3-(3-hydroxy-phenyl)propionate hydroxylase